MAVVTLNDYHLSNTALESTGFVLDLGVTISKVRWPKGTKIPDFICSAYRKIKSEILPKISDFTFSTYRKIKSEILPQISDLIVSTTEK